MKHTFSVGLNSHRFTVAPVYRLLSIPLLVLGILCSCNKPAAGGAHATVVMRDGTAVPGTILSSSASEIQIAGDDKVTRTIPMTQVRSVEYDSPTDVASTPAPATAPNQPPVAPTPATASGPTAPSAYPAQTPPGSTNPRDHAHEPERSHADHYHPTESAITTKTYDLPPGTQISVRNEETIDSSRAVEGQTFAAELTRDVTDAAGDVVIPRGSNAQIVIRSASRGGKIRGASDLVIDLASVSIDGRLYEISTADLAEKGRAGVGANRRTGEFAGGGAAIGAIIGAIAGGGRGAAIGAGAGAGAGALTQVLTKGTIKVPVESILTFQLDRPLRVVAAR